MNQQDERDHAEEAANAESVQAQQQDEQAYEALPVLLDTSPLADPDGARRSVSRYVRSLKEQLHLQVAAVRNDRFDRLGDLELGRTDVAPLIRSLAAYADVLTYAGKELLGLAKEAHAIVGEEVEVTGAKTVVTPDGLGREVVARISTPRSRVVDWSGLLSALAAMRAFEHERSLRAMEGQVITFDGPALMELLDDTHRTAYRQAQDDLASVTTAAIEKCASATKIDALSRALQAHRQDDLAGLLDRTMHWQDGEAKTTVTVEDPKARRRG